MSNDRVAFEDSMITTFDNDWNPFTNYDEWRQCDEEYGYRTEQLVAAFAKQAYETSDIDYEEAIETAIDQIIELMPDIYLRVYRKKE